MNIRSKLLQVGLLIIVIVSGGLSGCGASNSGPTDGGLPDTGGQDGGMKCNLGGFKCEGNKAYNCGPDSLWIVTDCSAILGMECSMDETGAKCRPLTAPDGGAGDTGTDAGVPVSLVMVPPGQNVDVGASKALVVNAWDQDGSQIAVAAGDVTWGVVTGGEFLQFDGGALAKGVAHGRANIFAIVGGVASPVQEIRVTVKPAGQLIPLLEGATKDDVNNVEAISRDGKVVVGNCSLGGKMQGFRWTKGSAPQGLDFLTGCDQCFPMGVNSDGSVIVGYCFDKDDNEIAFIWTAAGGTKKLEGFPGGVTDTMANGVSADGKRIVGNAWQGADVQLGFLWEDGKGVKLFGDFVPLSSPNHDCGISAISSDGKMFAGEIGYGLDTHGAVLYEAFIARQSGEDFWDMDFLTIPTQEDPNGTATAVNSDGTFVVGATGVGGPFEWSPSRGMVPLSPYREIKALAVSEDGTLVAGGEADPGTAFLWDTKLGYRNLLNLLMTNGMYQKDLESCSPSAVKGMSSDGQVMIGNCETTLFRAFYLELPE